MKGGVRIAALCLLEGGLGRSYRGGGGAVGKAVGRVCGLRRREDAVES